MAFIDIIPPEASDGRLKEVYDEAAGRRGRVASVLQIHSLMPETLKSHLQMYMDIMYGKGELTRLQREAIAVVVSSTNKCDYCVQHHAQALSKYLKDDEQVEMIAKDFERSTLDEATKVLCRHARKLTATPHDVAEADVQLLRDAGWNDAGILHATMVSAYFNWANRMVIGTGAELEGDFDGYKH